MNNEFKVGEFVAYGVEGKIAFILAIDGELLRLLFFDGSHGWHDVTFGDFSPTSNKWPANELEEVITHAFNRTDYYHLDNLTYIELLDKLKNGPNT